MNTPRTLALLTAALLIAGSAFAQVAPPAPANFDPDYQASSADISIATPKPRANLFLDVGFTYLKAAPENDDKNVDFYGVTAAFGWRIDKYSKIQLEIGGLAGSADYGRTAIDYIVAPELFTYSYCIPLGRNSPWELRLSPSVGFAYIFTDYESPTMWATDADLAFAFGGGIGVTYHVSKRFHLDAGYRYMKIAETEYNWGKLSEQKTQALTLSVGWKF